MGIMADPIEAFAKLMEDDTKIPYVQQAFLHGDLNTSNIAVDGSDDALEAYIFDAAGTRPDLRIRDLAQVEVSALLHQSIQTSASLVEECAFLFTGTFLPDETPQPDSPHLRNVFALIIELRKIARREQSERVYALAVLDYAVLQLGGLNFTVSANKIGTPRDAAVLVALCSHWYRNVAREA
jgi:hypothetical protein